MNTNPKAFCCECYEQVPYTVSSKETQASKLGIQFNYIETLCTCAQCGEPIYVSPIHNANIYARERAFYQAVNRMKGVSQRVGDP